IDAVNWFLDDIWPVIVAERPETRFRLIGRGPTQRALDAAKADSRISVDGYIDDLLPIAARAGAFICPMRHGGGTRLKLLHAMSMGLPVISTTMGMEGIEAIPGQHFLRADTPAEFVSEIGRVERNPDLGASLSRAGRGLAVGHYDWGHIGIVLREALET